MSSNSVPCWSGELLHVQKKEEEKKDLQSLCSSAVRCEEVEKMREKNNKDREKETKTKHKERGKGTKKQGEDHF